MLEKIQAFASYMGYKTWVAENGTIMAENAEGFAGHIDSPCLPFMYHQQIELLYPVARKVVAELREKEKEYNRPGFSLAVHLIEMRILHSNNLFESPPIHLFEAVYEGITLLGRWSQAAKNEM